MNRKKCPQLDLIDALHDGRLGPQEAASCVRHVQTCEVCAARQRQLTDLRTALRTPAPEPTPLDHQRARLGLLRAAAAGAADSPARTRRFALRWAAVGGLLFAVTAAAGVAAWRSSQAPAGAPAPAAAQSGEPAPVAEPPNPLKLRLPAVASATAVEATPAEVPAAAPSLRPAVHAKRVPTATAPAEPAATVAAPEDDDEPAQRSPASRDFAAAMAALETGDFSLAAGRFRTFAATYPRDARADEAAYLVAIALDRAGRAGAARAAAQRYLRDFERGAHRAQAAKLLAALAPAAGATDDVEEK